jgi:hypothetical protein
VRHRPAREGGLGRSTSLIIGGTVSEFTSFTSRAAVLAQADDAPPAPPAETQADATSTRSFTDVHPPSLVKQLYRDLLGRDADVHGLSYWLAKLRETGDSVRVAQGLLESDEFDERCGALGRVYFACLGGIPDYATLDAWLQRSWDGEPLDSIAAALMRNGEFVLRYGGLDDAAFVERLQAEVTAGPRLPIDPGRGDRLQHLLEICASAQCRARLGSRVQVATIFVRILRRRPDDSGWEFWNDDCAAAGPRRLLEVAMGTQEFLRRFD